MPRPNVKFKINDESLVVPAIEGFSTTIAGVYNPTNHLKVLGNTAEKEAGYYFVPNISEWFGRLNDYIIGLANGQTFIDGTTAYSLGSCAASYLNGLYPGDGISAGFSGEWWPIHNYLQYGGGCYVGFGAGLAGASAFYDLGMDVIFQGGNCGAPGNLFGEAVTTIVEYKEQNTDTPAIGVLYAKSIQSQIDNNLTGVYFTSGSGTRNYVKVFGEKIHLDTQGLYTIETPLAADVAGCIARTDREAYPWFSPAGSRRGRILNVLRLKRTLTKLEQDNLYDNRVNPVVSFPGEGTILYGDKTSDVPTTTLSRINVSRLFIYIKKALAPVARSILFEQNDAFTRARFKIAAEGFLDRVKAQRGITDYQVICDEGNNTPELIEANYFVADILIKPVTAINYVTITLTNKDLSSIL